MFEEHYADALTYLKYKGVTFINDVDILPNKELNNSIIDELHTKGYINKNDKSVWINKKGRDYLEPNLLPIQPLHNEAKKTITQKYQKGTFIVKILSSEWVRLIITGIIALIIGSYILVKLKIIK